MDRKFTEMRDRFDRRAQAMKTLYAALDPRQRAAMDALPEVAGRWHGGGAYGSHGALGPDGLWHVGDEPDQRAPGIRFDAPR